MFAPMFSETILDSTGTSSVDCPHPVKANTISPAANIPFKVFM
jgi:hypothetical protein